MPFTFDMYGGKLDDTIGKAMDKTMKAASIAVDKWGGSINGVLSKITKGAKKKSKGLKAAFGIGLDIIGIVLQMLDALGVLKPILDLVKNVFQAIGGGVMQVLAPAISKLAEILFSPEMMGLWTALGHLIGMILAPILKSFAIVLKALMPALKPLVKILGPTFALIIMIIAKAISLLILGALFPLAMAIWGIGLVIAAIVGFFTGNIDKAIQDWNNFMGPIVGGMLLGGLEILAMGSGGYVPPTSGGTIIRASEGGEGEFIIPESKMGNIGNEDMVYATQDNGDKLDRIIFLLGSQGRLR